MNIQLIFLLVSFLIFSSYLIYVICKVGVLPSISDSWYALNKSFLFTLFIWGTAFTMIIAASKDLMVLSGMALCFVGTAAAFKESMTKPVHIIGATGSAILVIISMIFEYHNYYTLVIVLLIVLYFNISKNKNKVWWSEFAVFVGSYAMVLMDLISKL